MSNKNLISKTKDALIGLPAGVMATLLSTLTLANVFNTLGFTYIRHFINYAAWILIIAGFLKLLYYPKQVITEMKTPGLSSVYPTFTMSMMLMGSYYVKYNFILGKSIWLAAIGLHIIIMIAFTYFHIIKKFDFNSFLPPYFVPYVGLIVATISGSAMESPGISTAIFYFSTVSYFIILIPMVYRLCTRSVDEKPYPTLAVMAAPPSLCLVAFLTLYPKGNFAYAVFVYILIFASVVYKFSRFPRIFRIKFIPTFGGITFPLAISTLATLKLSTYMSDNGYPFYSTLLKEFGGFQILFACAGIMFVVYNFISMFLDIYRTKKA